MGLLYKDAPDLTRDDEHLYWRERENLLGVSEVEKEVGLETDEWFIQLEDHGEANEHIHVQRRKGAVPFE